MRRSWAWIVGLFLLSGCGYKPMSSYTRDILGESISTEVAMTLADPESGVMAKDAINEAVLTRFQGRLVSQAEAQTHLRISTPSVVFEALQKDEAGYVIYYRTRVTMTTTITTDGKPARSYTTSGSYDFPIEVNSALSDSKRFDSIKNATLKALDELIARIALSGRPR